MTVCESKVTVAVGNGITGSGIGGALVHTFGFPMDAGRYSAAKVGSGIEPAGTSWCWHPGWCWHHAQALGELLGTHLGFQYMHTGRYSAAEVGSGGEPAGISCWHPGWHSSWCWHPGWCWHHADMGEAVSLSLWAGYR